ncbi:hypothetical protein [Streptomyces sp. NPDC058891]|uniref:hypothetical protein n=1 Tax=Streptomyces sp. NPDC058891 TaxID=3346667 RepID=UPI0036B48E71
MSSERTYGPRELPEDRPGSDQAASPAAELSDVLLVVATMTATPFLQAISTYFGNALAKGMGSGTREIMHRFIRRQARASLDDPADVVDLIHLRTEDGWLVEMKVAVEPEALAQLPELCAADAPLRSPIGAPARPRRSAGTTTATGSPRRYVKTGTASPSRGIRR